MANRTYHPRGELIDGFAPRKHPNYATWSNMLSRCTDPLSPSYTNYGARGITVDPAWFHFKNFVADMGMKPGKEFSIERIDNEKGYSKDNCKWATGTEQCLNRRQFKNNTSGTTGVVKTKSSWIARYDHAGIRYTIGWYESKEEAVYARTEFVKAFELNPAEALKLLPIDKARYTSQTGARGVNPHVDGYFIARCTIKGVRHYVGYFKTLEEAVTARARFIAEKT